MKLFKRKNGYYYIRISRENVKSLGTRDKREAKAIYEQEKQDIKDKKITYLEKVKRIRINEFKKEYIEARELQDIKQGTINNDDLALRKLRQTIGDQSLRLIKREEVNKFKITLLRQKCTRTYINILMRSLSAAFNYALTQGYISNNPFCKKDRNDQVLFKIDERLPRYLTREEINKLYEAITDKDFLLLIKIAIHTGMRRAEIARLKMQDIDLNNGILYARKTKGKKDRAIPIHDELRPSLKARLQDIGPLFPRWQFPDTLSALFRVHADNARIPDKDGRKVHFHDLRHTFASYLAMAGVDIYRIKELLGHSDIKTTMIYAKIKTEHLKADIDKLNFGG